ncbi:MAG: S1 RNA-binding domain-containing protein [Clostridia bacterium]
MKMNEYLPEGKISSAAACREYLSDLAGLENAIADDVILEGKAVLCDSERNLHVELGNGLVGIIPPDECVYDENKSEIKAIAVISRVGKSVCFKVRDIKSNVYGKTEIILSRRAAQRECRQVYISSLKSGDVISAKVTHIEPFGAFVDIGCGIVSLLSIDCMSVSRISHPSDRFFVGQYIKAVVRQPTDEYGRITLSHRELLGTWEENAALFGIGQTVTGVVRSIEKYGVFIELTPNLAGLAEYRDGLEQGDCVSVYIKNILPDKMKIKLVVIDKSENGRMCGKCNYFYDGEHMEYWRYSPENSVKLVETVFG